VSSLPPHSEPVEHLPGSSPSRLSQKALRIAAAVVWTLVIVTLCWTPGAVVHKLEYGSFFQLPNLDKVVHGSIFIVWSILCYRVAPSRRMTWIVILGGVALGVLTEVGQLMPSVGRDCEFYDMVIDCVGAVIGVLIAPFVEPWLQSLERLVFRQSPRESSSAQSALKQ
jgi:VanZ like family